MLNSKQRATLRAKSLTISPSLIVGKDGVNANTVISAKQLFDARELIKVNVLNNCESSAKEIALELEDALACDIVSVCGRKIVAYKLSSKENFKHIAF